MNRAFAVFFALGLAATAPAIAQTGASSGTGVTLIHNDETDKGLAAANRIKALMREHKLDDALAAAQEETQTHPEHAAAWYSLGDVLMVMQRFQDALSPLQKADQIDPKMGPNLYDLGFCLFKTNQTDASVDTLTREVARMPDFPPGWLLLYLACGAKHDTVAMEKKFKDYTVTYPNNPNAWCMLGEVQAYEQLPDSAVASWQKAVDLKPDYYEALRSLGLFYGRSGHPEKAVDYFARAAAVKPSAELVNNLGYAYLSLGQTDKAIEALKQALALDPKYEKALYNLTDAYGREKQWPLAWQTAQALAQINPASEAELTKNFPPPGSLPAPDPNAPPVQPAPVASAPASTPALTLAAPSAGTSSGLLLPPPLPVPTNAPPVAMPGVQSSTETNLATATPPASMLAPSDSITNTIPAPSASLAPAADSASTPVSPPVVTPAPSTSATASTATYTVGEPPAWVKPLDPDSVVDSSNANVEGGVDYILIDNQQLMDPQSTFSHYTVRLTNERGLETGADLRAEFDPNYQSLTINWLKVKRDGVWSDRLRADTFQLLHREENLDSQMLDGRYSAICHLQDIRVGDTVDFAYTVTGANPVFGGKFVSTILTGSLFPVRVCSNQVITAPNRKVSVKSFGGAPDPVRTTQPDQSELLVWRQENVPATQLEPRTSPWYDQLGWVQLSEFGSWQDVSDWGCANFSLNDPLSPELQQEVDAISSAHTALEPRALAAIDFVQNDVRYLGVEMGANSYKPTPANQVFAHRFGDCKDKTQLCVVMLRALGIDAWPALVSTTRGDATADLLPSPLAFDHAIVELAVDGQLYFVDLTRTDQRGQLRDLYTHDFRRALILRTNSNALVPVIVSRASLPQVTVDETYKVSEAASPSSLLIHTVFKGHAAESIRSSFSSASPAEIEKDYLQDYGRIYPQIKVETPLRYQDFPDDNRFELWQDYSIPGLWTREDSATPYKAAFTPLTVVDAVGTTTPTPRNTPYHLNYPSDVTENMEIQMFDKWDLNAFPNFIQTPSFNFTERPSLDGNTLRFQYHFETIAPDVLPDGIAEYNDKLERVRNSLEYHMSYTPGVSPGSQGAFRPNWMGISVIGCAFVISLILAIVVYCIHYEPDHGRSFYFAYAHYEGIGGWLILICINIGFGLLNYGKTAFFQLSVIFDQPHWDLLTQPGGVRYDPNWAPAILFEGVVSVFAIVILILAIVLMIQKRTTFPFVMIAYFVLNLIFAFIDHALVLRVTAMASTPANTVYATQILHVIVGCATWIPYLLVSKRVKVTFVN